MEKMFQNRIILALLIIPFFEPAFFEDCLPLVDAGFLIWKVLSALAVFLYAGKTHRFSGLFGILMVLQVYLLINTLAQDGRVGDVAKQVINVAALCLIIEIGMVKNRGGLLLVMALYFWVLLAVSVVTTVACPEGLYFLEDNFYQTGNRVNAVRFFLGHKNSVIMELLPGFLAFGLLSLLDGRRSFRFGALIYGILMLLLACMVDSVNSAAFCVFALAAYLLSCSRLSQDVKAGTGLAFIGGVDVLVTNEGTRNVLAGFLSGLNRDPTLSGRDAIWSAALAYIDQSPLFGHGIEANAVALTRFGGFYTAHSMYLTMLAYGGVIGLALLAACFLVALRGVSGVRTPEAAFAKQIVFGVLLMGVLETFGIGCSVTVVPLAFAYAVGTKRGEGRFAAGGSWQRDWGSGRGIWRRGVERG